MTFAAEVKSGQRFEFGKNWQRFLATINDDRIAAAEKGLNQMLGDIDGKTFLDVGCGSGLSSLAAHRLGAKVYAFDYDPQSVSCARELQRRYGVSWPVESGSALNSDYLAALGAFDVVYSWGVLHHTGAMWNGLENMVPLVNRGGLLFVAIYNDQGWKSNAWRIVKTAYNKSAAARGLLLATLATTITATRFFVRAITGRLRVDRGMSLWYDAVDWLGGYPFEVASPATVVEFYRQKGFVAHKTALVGGRSGCNEFVFRYDDAGS
jgi:2-polyprenyl-3-methyl-5-hydroxy-6-metoxy-1,4-benzoquinol methylase